MKQIYKIIGFAIVLVGLLMASFFIGKNQAKKEIVYETNTVFKYDTITKVIKEPYAVVKDFYVYVELPGKIDTVTVIKEYFSKHYVERQFKDSNIIVTVKDTLYKNDIESGKMEYKWLQPTSVITNTTNVNNYYNYVSLGVSTNDVMNIQSVSLDLSLHMKKWYFITGYDIQQKQFKAGIGTTLFKFK
jgi:hypothetical protein